MADLVELEQRGAVMWMWLNRPALHNALDDATVLELTSRFRDLGADPNIRVLVLTGRGASFCAGADIESMKRLGAADEPTNLRAARELAEMFRAIAECPKPTIARVNGAAIGGGLGLVSCCDIAIAAGSAKFAASEVRLGLIPATIGPYVVRAIGPRWARRLFLTGERISAAQAEKMGLVHASVLAEELDAAVDAVVNNILAGAPRAQAAAKKLIDDVADRPITRELIEDTAMRIAAIRTFGEAREGLNAFLEKRPASWAPQSKS
ncbi:MAG: enoyl-CoA hydratase-related protein [Acidobacteriota bacterium]